MPEAVMKPEITGWLRKFARNPSRNNPMATNSSPERTASVMAAPRYSGVPWVATVAAAAAVIRLATATGPTASAREVPKIAYSTSGAIEAYSPTCGGSPTSIA